ncbi:Holliday junction branch migration protein RuvA [Thermosipho ferrireducens]|uniref:Holliday junction branch migration complex subunit RuvA n=1 Tax=Thermosipho ferrireducens TaxID=2571116 RepID=A0ABX7S9L4_9BACT|nr:Holliday junction branch migration protein RuvA [Thermosipho ferrireducens]QTA38586.1 Holliday junction branch migration protein RuvA [Thermosipho ferrireducens]
MIYAVKGLLYSVLDGKAYVDVGNFILEIVVGNTVELSGLTGSEIKFYTKLIISEDNITLYGFGEEKKLRLFEKLISVSKLGPKTALKILSTNNVEEIVAKIINEDAKGLSQLPGIGKKTAERIIMELKDNLAEFNVSFSEKDKKMQEAIEALTTLGFSPNQSRKAVNSVAETNDSLDEIIKKALKHLTRS